MKPKSEHDARMSALTAAFRKVEALDNASLRFLLSTVIEKHGLTEVGEYRIVRREGK